VLKSSLMNWYAFKERFRNNYKKFLAIIFSSIAIALMLAFAITTLIDYVFFNIPLSVSTPFDVFNIALFLVAYIVILVGNVNSSNSAYRGVLIYIFASAFSAAITLLVSGLPTLNNFLTGNPLFIALTLAELLFNVFGLIAGIFSYIRLSQYLRSSFVYYERVRNWTLAFVIFQILSTGFVPVLAVLTGTSGLSVLMAFLSPLSEIFICLAIYFTVLRLRSY